jgi:hypothetical protein
MTSLADRPDMLAWHHAGKRVALQVLTWALLFLLAGICFQCRIRGPKSCNWQRFPLDFSVIFITFKTCANVIRWHKAWLGCIRRLRNLYCTAIWRASTSCSTTNGTLRYELCTLFSFELFWM